RLLILADNAADSEQLRPLLPGPGCLVIATSRNQLRGLAVTDAARQVAVPPLPEPEGLALLGRIVGDGRGGAEPEAAAALVARCGGLPLAVVIAAEQAQRQPGVPLAGLVEQMRSEADRLDLLSTGDDLTTDLRTVFTWSYRRLGAAEARTFRYA